MSPDFHQEICLGCGYRTGKHITPPNGIRDKHRLICPDNDRYTFISSGIYQNVDSPKPRRYDPPEPVDNHDPVSSPNHYTSGGIECIDALEAALTPEEFRGFCKANAIKYIWRSNLKGNHDQDIAKAQWYLDRLSG